MHVHIGRRDRLDRQHGAAEFLEVVGHDGGQLLGKRAAIVDRDDLAPLHHIVDVGGIRLALIEVAVDGAHVAVVLGFAVRCGELGRRGRRRDVHDPLLPQDRRTRGRGAGACGSDHDDGVRVGCEFGRRSLAALGVAAVVLGAELDRMAGNHAAVVLECDLDRPHLIGAERGVRPRDHVVAADLDRRPLRDRDDADVVGHRADRRGLGQR